MHERIENDLKEAMRSKNTVRLSVLRNIKSGATNELVATGRKPQEQLSEEELLAVIKRLAKQRKESIVEFEKAGRQELANKEKGELSILEEYLPEELSDEAINEIVQRKKEELGSADTDGFGQLMSAVMKEIGQQADGNRVRTFVQEALS